MAARQLYEAAGAWSELLSLCALQGDFMSVRDYMQSVWPLLLSAHMSWTPKTGCACGATDILIERSCSFLHALSILECAFACIEQLSETRPSL